jgi:flagellar biosynthesis chaperone FliJ
LRASADEIARADDRWHAAAALYTRTIRDGIDPDTLERHRVWMDRLRADGAGWRATYEARRREVARATAALTEVHQQVRVLERLRDRLERKHAAALGRQDRRELDEAAAIRFAARVGPGHDQDRAK